MTPVRLTCALLAPLAAALLIGGCGEKQDDKMSARSETPPAESARATREVHFESLRGRLLSKRVRWMQSAPPEKRKLYEDGIEAVRATGVEQTALGIGDRAPDFALPSAGGGTIQLSELLKSGPVVLKWYRGGWCPYCNLELQAYQEWLPAFENEGATIVAISPERPKYAVSTAEQSDLGYLVVSDVGNAVARNYGLVFKLPAGVHEAYLAAFDMTERNGDASGELPLAATFIVDEGGTIRYAFADADYRVRAEPSEVVAALRSLP